MKNQKRQVVLIMTDTQRTDMLGCYGHSDMITPNLDKLASEGVRFDRAYTCQPVCGPARSAIFTGTYPHSNGSWSNSVPLGENVKTIGQRLSDNGIKAGYIGKYHLDGGDYFGNGMAPEGWETETWYDMKNYLDELSRKDRIKSRTMETLNNESVPSDFTFGHRCTDRARDFIEQNSDEDFFLTVSYDEPHDPYLCPKEFVDLYEDYEFPKKDNVWDTLEDKPEHLQAWSEHRRFSDRDKLKIEPKWFFGCNSYIDSQVGRVLESIEKSAPDALVIYTSDHGDFLESHSLCGKGPSAYDEIARIPLIMRCPEISQSGAVAPNPASHIDITPTVLDYFGIERSRVLEGQSILPTLENPELNQNPEVFIEFGRYEIDHDGFGGFQPMRSVFDGRMKLTINLLSSDELYDIKNDPDEMNNLINSSETAEKRDALHNRLLDWMNTTRDPFRGYYWERRPWRADAAEATWKYTGFTRQREEDLKYEPKQLDYATGLEIDNPVRKK